MEKLGNAECECVRVSKAGKQEPLHVTGEGWRSRSGQHPELFVDAHPGGNCWACRRCTHRRGLLSWERSLQQHFVVVLCVCVCVCVCVCARASLLICAGRWRQPWQGVRSNLSVHLWERSWWTLSTEYWAAVRSYSLSTHLYSNMMNINCPLFSSVHSLFWNEDRA